MSGALCNARYVHFTDVLLLMVEGHGLCPTLFPSPAKMHAGYKFVPQAFKSVFPSYPECGL